MNFKPLTPKIKTMSTIPKEIKEVDTQFAKSMTSDFEEGTWTFLMPKKFQVWAGDFAIVDKQVYDKMTAQITALQSSLKETKAISEAIRSSRDELREELKEKEKECEEAKLDRDTFSELLDEQSKQIEELKAENERLKDQLDNIVP